MYRSIRAIHLCLGLFSVVFLVAYSISAVQMTHTKWLRMTPAVTERQVELPANLTDARVAARELAARYGISGDLTAIRVTPGGLGFRVLHPGLVWQAEYTSSSGATRLRITDTGILGALNRIHQMRGLWHTWAAYNIWAGLLALVGLAILSLGATGVYLWWKTNRTRRFTGALLMFSIVVIGGMAAWMRLTGS